MTFTIIFLLLIGLAIGSFCTVCVFRIPKNLSIIKPRSFCPSCKKQIKWFFNIPLISFIFLRGKCSFCKKKISWVYPIIEIITVTSLLLLYCYFETINLEYIFLSFFFISLIILFFCDLKFFLLPNVIIFPLFFIGFLRCFISPNSIFFTSTINSVAGFLLGLGFLYFFAKAYKFIRKKEGMGMGDIKLLGALGLWLGWKSLFFIIIISALLGIIFGIIAISLGKMKIQSKIPYGCFLVLSVFLYTFFINPITSFYEKYMFLF